MRVFNTTAVCIPAKHYMVDLSERVQEIKKLVDAEKYFSTEQSFVKAFCRLFRKNPVLYMEIPTEIRNQFDDLIIPGDQPMR